MRKMYAEQAPSFLAHYLPGLVRGSVRFVPHHVAHAASAGLAAPYPTNSVLVLDGRGEARQPPGRPVHRRAAGGAGQPGAPALPRPALRGPDRAPRLPAQQRRVQGHGDGVLRQAALRRRAGGRRPRHRGRRLPDGEGRLRRVRAAAAAGRRVDRGARRPRRQRPAAAGGDAARPGALAARAHRRHAPSPWPAAWPSTAWPTAGSTPRARSSTSGCSRRPATPARHWAGRCPSPATWATRPSRCPGRTSAAAGPTRRSRRG